MVIVKRWHCKDPSTQAPAGHAQRLWHETIELYCSIAAACALVPINCSTFMSRVELWQHCLFQEHSRFSRHKVLDCCQKIKQAKTVILVQCPNFFTDVPKFVAPVSSDALSLVPSEVGSPNAPRCGNRIGNRSAPRESTNRVQWSSLHSFSPNL